MKRVIISTIVVAIIVVGAVTVKLMTSQKEQNVVKKPVDDEQVKKDWPVYTFAEMMTDKVDVVAFVTVVQTSDMDERARLSTLRIDELIFESEEGMVGADEITLNQMFDYVEEGESYLVFLQKAGVEYVRVSLPSLIKAREGKYEVQMEGLRGYYDKAEFKRSFQHNLSKIGEEVMIDYKKVTYGHVSENNGGMFQVKDSTVTPTGLTVIFNNDSEQDGTYGEHFQLDRKVDGEWIEVPDILEGHFGFPDIGYELDPRATAELVVDWEWLYGSLEQGEYRIKKYVYFREEFGDYGRRDFAAPFEVK